MRLLLLLVSFVLVSACGGGRLYLEPEPGRGDAARGKELAVLHECYDCHIIPGIDRKPGPGVPSSLAGLARRDRIVAKQVENTRDNLETYLQYPKKVAPRSLMPGLGDRPEAARDIAAYLVTLD
ncbi:MAG TPA: cytochrome C [Thermoanaerobaculia bacterium]